jgi:hypothetical protein
LLFQSKVAFFVIFVGIFGSLLTPVFSLDFASATSGVNINNKKSLNELLLEGGYATIYQEFCGISEFSLAGWAQSRGC